MKKITLIIAIVVIIGIVMWYVWNKSKSTVLEKDENVELTPRVQELVSRVPFETRKKIVNLYSWYVKNGDTIILKDGKVFNVTKNQPDQWNRTSIERYRLDTVLWDVKKNRGLIDDSLEWWLKSTMKFSLAEYKVSLNVK